MKKKKYLIITLSITVSLLLIFTAIHFFNVNFVDRITFYNQSNYTKNIYSKYSNNLFHMTQDFYVNEESEFYDILFTALNNRWDTVNFKCSYKYDTCLNDFRLLTTDKVKMTALNDYVHPYYQYRTLKYRSDFFGNVVISIDYLYSMEDIANINSEIFKLGLKDINEINNYVINNINYEINRNSVLELIYLKKANCKAITDFINICLFNLNINSYAISNDIHSWNIIIEGGKKLNLDSTWNMKTGNRYYLIDTDTLEEFNEEEHVINEIYNYF